MKMNDTLLSCVKADVAAGNIPLLLGEPGIGKTSWVTSSLPAALRAPAYFVWACNQLADKADVTGMRLVDDGHGSLTQKTYPHETVSAACDWAEAHPRDICILVMDEINRTTADVTSELLGVATLRHLGSRKLPDNLRIVATGNDHGNVTTLDSAAISRFSIYHVTPDAETYLALRDDIHPAITNVLTEHPETIFCKQTPTETESTAELDDVFGDVDAFEQFTCPRTIDYLDCWMTNLTDDELKSLLSTPGTTADTTMLTELIEGHVGATPFASYLTAEIATSIAKPKRTSKIKIVRPDIIDNIIDIDTRGELAVEVDSWSANEKSGALLWALSDNKDHDALIDVILDMDGKLEAADLATFVTAWQAGNLDEHNLSVLRNSPSEFSQSLTTLFSIND